MTNVRGFFGRDSGGGQAIVMVAIVFMALLFAVGLAVDAGQLFAAKRAQQEAADAAAFAGAVVLYQGGSVTQATQAAIDDAGRNGYSDGVNSTTVTVNGYSAAQGTYGPSSGPYAGEVPIMHVEVIIVRQVKTTLVPAEAAFNPVRARGVAGSESLNNGYPIMSLGTGCGTPGLTVSPNEDIHVYGGGIVTNSCSASGVSGFGAGQDLKICASPPAACTPNPYTFGVVGGTSGSSFPAGITVQTGITAVADPFAGYPKPDGRSYNGVNSLPTNPATIGLTSTWPEGIYTGSLSGPLCHGIYILKGNGFNGITQDTNGAHVDANTNTACDGKVMIYNTMSGYPASTGTCSGMSGGSVIRPLTTGIYSYMTIYQDPACTASLSESGNNTLDATGTLYLPNGTIDLNGNPATVVGGQLIAKQINVQNGNLTITYTSTTTATPTLPRLAE